MCPLDPAAELVDEIRGPPSILIPSHPVLDDTPIPLENVTRLLPSLEPNERRSESGRVILTRDALHFIQGWETHSHDSRGGGMLGAIVSVASRAPEVVDTWAEGARILAEVKALAPAEQVRIVSGSAVRVRSPPPGRVRPATLAPRPRSPRTTAACREPP